MNEFKKAQRLLMSIQETMERLALGEAGLLEKDVKADDIVRLIDAVRDVAEMVEIELGVKSITKTDDRDIARMALGWMKNVG
jgi:hypothetical protein